MGSNHSRNSIIGKNAKEIPPTAIDRNRTCAVHVGNNLLETLNGNSILRRYFIVCEVSPVEWIFFKWGTQMQSGRYLWTYACDKKFYAELDLIGTFKLAQVYSAVEAACNHKQYDPFTYNCDQWTQVVVDKLLLTKSVVNDIEEHTIMGYNWAKDVT